jgi:hypothetical protein
MSNVFWCDRGEHKKAFAAWLPSEHGFSVVGVSDSEQREIFDIARWVRSNARMPVLSAFYNFDIEARKAALLEQLTRASGQSDLFSRYYRCLNQIEQAAPNLNLNFSVGDSARADGDITYTNIEQKAEVDPVKLAAASDILKEQKIQVLLDDFFLGVKEILRKEKSLLFLVTFAGHGFSSMQPTFKDWFLGSFCTAVKGVDGIRLSVLNSGRIDDLCGIGADCEMEIRRHLSLQDTLDEAYLHLQCFGGKDRAEEFCKGVVDLDGQVTYTYFKRKLVNRLQEQVS